MDTNKTFECINSLQNNRNVTPNLFHILVASLLHYKRYSDRLHSSSSQVVKKNPESYIVGPLRWRVISEWLFHFLNYMEVLLLSFLFVYKIPFRPKIRGNYSLRDPHFQCISFIYRFIRLLLWVQCIVAPYWKIWLKGDLTSRYL